VGKRLSGYMASHELVLFMYLQSLVSISGYNEANALNLDLLNHLKLFEQSQNSTTSFSGKEFGILSTECIYGEKYLQRRNAV
jgi:hypothetical protein